ncbi:DinB family protein [Exiguobacterium antarcticum]|uniref:DinB family protein n=1 Tax=Exiguobacterium antarcticum TaxID=132920 RepID=A0ABT6QZW9_9BACL|nr:DinB family protein [Exiguobacterium antarcticum]MDI3234234.1 DinB family protein [Exiguobacterium antarcticum]
MTDWQQALDRHVGVGVRTTQALIQLIQPEDWNKRPIPGKRSVYEVAVHLTVLLEADLRIATGATAEEMAQFYAVPVPPGQLIDRLDQSWRYYQDRLTTGFSTETTYWGVADGSTGWLMEAAVHLYHHRSQLFDYLNLLGYEMDVILFE